MIQPDWGEVLLKVRIPASPAGGLWTPVLDWLPGPRKYKVAAEGRWGLQTDRICGADGDSWSTDFIEKCLHTGSGRGALIGKIGGGTADRTGYIFPVGRLTVVDIPETAGSSGPQKGALFLTMNDEPVRFREHSGELLVSIWEAA